ncbi:CubicO group peptidase (beta-lactamase class C family) [Aquimarina sp. EL_43]|uniref:serine hydrolase domain-containing protein n=1 Tax=unclassified Aquimarina TaxID=2627091 RepID=UPI0018CB835F|nr:MULTISPECIES: serine hydrolase domain-containing protein [unclassified Aquimarina]MBG6132868.1 CubicO group peptidase (beta-lactamase class C family) [Aquimarina sp. EL_35]MBG6153055.1 CubicO group peptidase (beta-lactamase class C family) [Aquimarina sp. EL_32]MBG6171211.1 CubicO group peptidase (beta-lactamase class C family) [Aquimarina sp. EL_43]
MIKLKYLVSFISGIIFISCASTNAQKLPKNIRVQTQKRIDNGYHLGTVIGIVDKTGTHYYGFGQMSLSDTNTPDENSFFEIASITKPFTTALLADLELKKEINIHDPIEIYLPVFKKVLANSTRKISLENLVTHTSGLPRNPSNTTTSDSNRYKDYSVDDLNEFLSSYKIDSKTSSYLYSNLAYLVLEHAIETKMKTSYESLINDRITTVLNMKDTHFVVPDKKRNRLVSGYRNGKQIDEVDLGKFPAMGGLKVTTKDMVRFLEAQLGMYPSNLDKALKLTHKERFSDGDKIMGLGWSILKRKESGKTIHYHKGGTNGFVSFAGFNLEDQIGVVVLVNGSRHFSDLGFKLLDPTYPLSQPQ